MSVFLQLLLSLRTLRDIFNSELFEEDEIKTVIWALDLFLLAAVLVSVSHNQCKTHRFSVGDCGRVEDWDSHSERHRKDSSKQDDRGGQSPMESDRLLPDRKRKRHRELAQYGKGVGKTKETGGTRHAEIRWS